MEDSLANAPDEPAGLQGICSLYLVTMTFTMLEREVVIALLFF